MLNDSNDNLINGFIDHYDLATRCVLNLCMFEKIILQVAYNEGKSEAPRSFVILKDNLRNIANFVRYDKYGKDRQHIKFYIFQLLFM